MGAGAMGSVYAAHFSEAGHNVTIVDPWLAHINAISKSGLRLEGASGDRVVNITHACQYPDQLPATLAPELVIIATKAAAVGQAAQAIQPICTDQTLILTIQNGLGSGDRISRYIDSHNVLLGVADGFGASIKAPGHAHHNAMKLIRIGEMNGGMTQRLRDLATLWQAAGFDVKAFPDINQLIWEKFLCNVTFSGPCTVFDCTLSQLMSCEEKWSVALGCMQEAWKLGQQQQITFSFTDPVAYVTDFGLRMPSGTPSMLLDHRQRKRSEIDAINGMVSTLGRTMHVETPYNDTVSAIIHSREEMFDSP